MDLETIPQPSTIKSYGFALLAVGAGWLARQLLSPLIGSNSFAFIGFFPAVAVTAWYGGLGPAVLSVALSALVADWVFLPPAQTLMIANAADLAATLTFVGASALIISPIEALRRSQMRLAIQVEDHRRARLKITESHDLLTTTLASIGDGVIVTDTAGRLTFINPEAERLTGWAASEASGQALSTVFKIVNERTRETVDNPVDKVFRLGTVVGLANHTVLLSRDGRETPIDDSAAPVRRAGSPLSGVVLVFRDVAAQRQAHLAQARLSAIVEFSGDAILSKALDGTILTWNAGAERIFGYRPDEVVGRSIQILIPAERLDEEERILASIRAGQPYERFETIRITKNGRHLPVSVSVSPLKDADGQVVGASKILHDISDIVAAREALAREKDLLATTLASIGDAVIVTDSNGHVTFINAEAERLTGWPASEARTRTLTTIFNIVNEQTRQTVENPVDKVFRLGAVVGLANHTILIARDGQETPIDDSAAPIRAGRSSPEGVVLVFRDVTTRHLAEKAIHESEARFRLVADAAPVLVWMSGTDKLCTWFNKGWLDFVGRTMNEEVGNGWLENVHVDDVDRTLATYLLAFDARQSFSMTYRLRHRSGEYRWILDTGVPHFGLDGAFAGYIGSGIDITDRIQAEEGLKQEDRRKDEFLAILSHELRNPLAPISMAVQMLEKVGPAEPQLQQLRDIIRRQSAQLARLLDDLLDVSRIRLGKITLRTTRTNVAVAVLSAVEAARPLIDAQHHELVMQLSTDPLDVEADVNRLSQIFANLLNNAAKYTKRGGRITLTLEREADDAVVRVCDTGIGIAADQLSRVFDLFTQGDQSLERTHGGLGVGLSLAKALVDLHRGRITAHSSGLGHGSEFIVRLPLLGAFADQPTSAPVMLDPMPGHRPRRILIADDNVDSTIVMAAVLRDLGHHVVTVHDGAAAVDTAASFLPELVILDIGMPKLNGYEAARLIRTAAAGQQRPVTLIAVTGWGQEEDKRRAFEAGFDRHMTKPVDVAAIQQVIGGLS